MKPASPTLLAFLASNRRFVKVDVFTFELVGGSDDNYRLRYTAGQQDLSAYPVDTSDPVRRLYKAGAVIISGLRAKQSIGVDVDEQQAKFTPAAATLVQGLPFNQAVIEGVFDGALVRRDRYYFDAEDPLGEPIGGIPMFVGLVSTFDEVGRTDATLKVKSGTVLLNMPMPRALFQPTCRNRVFDAACGLDPDAFAVHGVVGASPTTTFIPWTSATAGMTQGRVFFEDLGIVGVWRAIKSADTSGLTLAYPLPEPPTPGENFTVYPGCNRTWTRCGELGNQARYRATRFIPQAEKAF